MKRVALMKQELAIWRDRSRFRRAEDVQESIRPLERRLERIRASHPEESES